MKLTPSKMLSSMALGALFVAAAGTQTAMASDFSIDTGNASQGAQATQSAIIEGGKDAIGANNPAPTASGDIQINGSFTKTITNLPDPTEEGRYLRVTMPIQMNYSYDVDTNNFTGATGTILNQSVYATETQPNSGVFDLEPQPIQMSFVGLSDGTTTTTDAPVEFVNKIDPTDLTNIQLPLQFALSGQSTQAKAYTFNDIQTNSVNDIVQIQGNSSVQLGIELISGETVGNTDLIQKALSQATHDLHLQFEYVGK